MTIAFIIYWVILVGFSVWQLYPTFRDHIKSEGNIGGAFVTIGVICIVLALSFVVTAIVLNLFGLF